MSLYNLLYGTNVAAPVLMAALGIDESNVPRFRDCYLTKDKKYIAIHTRTGGGNRDMYEHPVRSRENYPEYYQEGKESDWPTGPWNSDLRKLPGFQYDKDDDYDETYATFYFDVPEHLKHLLEELPVGETPAKRWQETIEKLKTDPENDPIIQKMKPIMESLISKTESGEGGVIEI